jgi:hypothetical protein
MFDIEQPAVPALLIEYVTAPAPLPPLVSNFKLVRNTAEVDVKVRVACGKGLTTKLVVTPTLSASYAVIEITVEPDDPISV